MISLIYFIIGGSGLAASVYFPVKNKLNGDHCIGIGFCGIMWMFLCIFGAYRFS